MKKKLLSILLVLAMTVSMATLLVACGDDEHTHTYATEWTADDTHHWHSATCEHTTEVSDKAEHNWGVDDKCTVCQKEKTENGGSSEGLTQVEWNAMFAAEALSNCTVVQTQDIQQTMYDSGSEFIIHTVVTSKFADDKVLYKIVGGSVGEQPWENTELHTGVTADEKRSFFELIITLLNEYEYFTYDAAQDIYNATKTVSTTIMEMGTSYVVEMSEGEVRVSADGKLVSVSYKYMQTIEGGVLNGDVTWEFSDYGTTVIDG